MNDTGKKIEEISKIFKTVVDTNLNDSENFEKNFEKFKEQAELFKDNFEKTKV